ncbi:MAG TPA: tripartite tricarboxylate transporter substrate binding protein [Burkholderiales bacterium]|nr:tripartite tricarboxylate transporter substrate binding protein [Burkholderiales bacterium]
MQKRFKRIAAALLLGAAVTGAAHAQSYPGKPIRLVLPFAPGAPSDMVGRTIGQKMGEQMGQNFIPDNRAGAGGTVGLGMVAKSPPDGYTILVTSPTIALGPLLYSNLSFEPKDFAPVARLATIENVMLLHPAVPAKTLKEFIALARAQPGKLNYGSGGPGTTNHLANELLKSLEKINLVHVPYKGATLATVALMGGEVDEVILGVAPALPFIKQGRVKPLVVLSEKRVASLPNVPTSKEAGFPNFQMSIWYGMFAPAGTPRDIVERLHREVAKALQDPALRQQMANAGMDPWLGTPDDLGALLRNETVRYSKIIQSAGIKKDAL